MPRDDPFYQYTRNALGEPELSKQSPPLANVEAEHGLLGSILIQNRIYEQVADTLRPEHFSYLVHGRIYDAIGKLRDRGEPANPITLKNLFDQDGALQDIGGAQYLVTLAERAVTTLNGLHYARTIKDLAERRAIDAAALDLRDEVHNFDLERTTADIIEKFRSAAYRH